jgi:hypothetical protein
VLKLKKFIIVVLIISLSSIGTAVADTEKTNPLVTTVEETNGIPIHPPVG